MIENLTCAGCLHEPQIQEIAKLAASTREIVDVTAPDSIDSAINIVVKSDKAPASPVIDQQVAGVIDLTASLSAIALSVDTGVLEEIEDTLISGQCDASARVESLTGCPKLDELYPKMVVLVAGLKHPE